MPSTSHSLPSSIISTLPSFTKIRPTPAPDVTPPASESPELPNLRTIDHPGVRRIGPDAFLFFDPATELTKFAARDAISAQTVISYCDHDRLIRGLSNLTQYIVPSPIGYDKQAALFNDHATGQRKFAVWDDVKGTYVTEGVHITPADFCLRLPRPPRPSRPARPPATEPRRERSNKSSSLFGDMLRVAAAAETTRRMNGNKYFSTRNRRRVARGGAQTSVHQLGNRNSHTFAGPSSQSVNPITITDDDSLMEEEPSSEVATGTNA